MTVSEKLCESEANRNGKSDNNAMNDGSSAVIDRLKEMERIEGALHKNDKLIDRLYGFIVE